jgi:dephospho-CoA kinase
MVSVVGIVGPIGSGKDTAADYIAEKYGYRIFSFRDVVREETEKGGIEPNRENMQKVGRELRDREGENVFSKIILKKIITSNCEKALVKELRTAGDIKTISDQFRGSMKIIKVTATVQARFERMRTRQRPGDPNTLEEFQRQEKREEELGYTKAFNFCDFVVQNNGAKNELLKKIDDVMSRLDEDRSLAKKRFL